MKKVKLILLAVGLLSIPMSFTSCTVDSDDAICWQCREVTPDGDEVETFHTCYENTKDQWISDHSANGNSAFCELD